MQAFMRNSNAKDFSSVVLLSEMMRIDSRPQSRGESAESWNQDSLGPNAQQTLKGLCAF